MISLRLINLKFNGLHFSSQGKIKALSIGHEIWVTLKMKLRHFWNVSDFSLIFNMFISLFACMYIYDIKYAY